MFWKDGLSKKFAPEHDLFCNIWKDGISFFQKIWYFFFRRKMKEDDLCQNTRGNMVFSVYMSGRYKHDKKAKMTLPQKVNLRVTSPVSPKKIIFILENMVFLLKYHIDWHPRKSPKEAATGDVLQEKVFLEISQNSQEMTCVRASFLIKQQA